MAEKYDVEKLKEILERYHPGNLLKKYGLAHLEGEMEDEDIINELVNAERSVKKVLDNLQLDLTYDVLKGIAYDLTCLRDSSVKIAKILKKEKEETGEVSGYLGNKLKENLEKIKRLKEEEKHVSKFVGYIRKARARLR